MKTIGKIHSLGGAEAEITIIEKVGDNDYIVDCNGVRCHAIFNWFVNRYYVDDVYGKCKTLVEELQEQIQKHPNAGGFSIKQSDKEQVKQWLHDKGYKCEPSGCYDKIHIEYWRN